MACEHLRSGHMDFALRGKLIHKDECTLCFTSSKDEAGISVCLKCFNGGCALHANLHFEKTGHALVVNIKKEVIVMQQRETQKITKLAIGKEGGAAYSGEEWTTNWEVRCLECRIPLTLPRDMDPFIHGILESNSAMFETVVGEWEMEYKPCTHTKGLRQTGGIIAEKSLAGCGDCELRANLWLCMTCGHLGCGRKAYDGSGGNGHGVSHHETSGHPLVCKMGTITPEGKAAIHCYACDEEVIDDSLSQHLATFGINVSAQVKTEKTILELELEMNMNLTLSKAIEKGKILVPRYGPGFTGLVNLGNSCYMNSCVQTLFSFPQFSNRYYDLEHQMICKRPDPAQCLFCQLSKLLDGLFSGRYSQQKKTLPVEIEHGVFTDPEEYQDGIKPQMFKAVVGKGSKDFMSAHQQDAFEYFQHFLGTLEKGERANGTPNLFPGGIFNFTLISKMKCQRCNRVTYRDQKTNCMQMDIPILTSEDSDEKMVDFGLCLQNWGAASSVDMHCGFCKTTTTFSKWFKFQNYPEVLFVLMQRFVAQNWVPQKLKCGVLIPTEIFSLEQFRHSKDPLEEQIPEGVSGPVFNQQHLNELMAMGFSELQCQHALLVPENQNSVEAATNWLIANLDNPEINKPLGGSKEPNETDISNLEVMGFSRSQVYRALKETNGDLDRAVDYLFSHSEEMDVEQAVQEAPTSSSYQLKGFITHLGPSVHSGHYVAHIKKEGEWIYFNDNKVAATDSPPTERAYIYFFSRV